MQLQCFAVCSAADRCAAIIERDGFIRLVSEAVHVAPRTCRAHAAAAPSRAMSSGTGPSVRVRRESSRVHYI